MTNQCGVFVCATIFNMGSGYTCLLGIGGCACLLVSHVYCNVYIHVILKVWLIYYPVQGWVYSRQNLFFLGWKNQAEKIPLGEKLPTLALYFLFVVCTSSKKEKKMF